MSMRTTVAVVVTSLAMLGAPVVAVADPVADTAGEPTNVGDAKIAATQYHDSGQYMTDLAEVAAQAMNWIGTQAPTTNRPAVVFDIDETSLSNWEVIKADDFGYFANGPCNLPDPCPFRSWDLLARSTVIQPTLDTYNMAKSLGMAVFFITGRDEGQRAATEKNLQSAGYTGYNRLIMEPIGVKYQSATDFKAPQRAAIEGEGYTIVANIGDQPSDLAGGHAERTFLLPDPFYRIP
ncbi:HAD family acid phosphatase [Mycobacterium sp.]|jgi:acid phosphatase|uniref:HAD family acid phosphatase n=1 Tax=Mycobacterium sp. TaxID=1785 RepID=UPI002D5895A7|nr:HAD family acid phosphatase [Mycobacterium sp.]HZA09205.1 HAD family acid phosphatase [Mycobacterium sp.]